MKMKLVYCFDAYCGVCYGFSNEIKKIFQDYQREMPFELISGGMIRPEKPVHISSIAEYIKKSYPTVEELSGVKFGKDYLWHIYHPEESDWYPDSLMPAVAFCVFREYYPGIDVLIASDIQKALFDEGRDLTDPEAYRHLLEKYPIPEEDFFPALHSEEFREKAEYDFALTRQLKVTGFPAVFLQVGVLKFYMVARGFTKYEDLKRNVEAVKQAVQQKS